eukprot:1021606-Prymnesium_polylepis.2
MDGGRGEVDSRQRALRLAEHSSPPPPPPPSCYQVQRFLHAIDESGGIYAHRWGDAPIQTIAIQLFASVSSVARLPTDYLHVSTMN